jgi:hypothetical protein
MAVKRTKPLKLMVHPFRLAKLDLKPGDFVVLQTDLLLDKDQVMRLKRLADQQLKPLKVKIIILVGGLKIGVLRKRTK